ncbi:hypothetical protein BMJ32_31350 [Sinorhizobium medicae]|nr:hypothetical protein BMJ35_10495 [Sinorhizobium medicae]PLT94927.1 hypothetical protein BMJ32_31350 [Sinorhizobium medicae]PLU09602.1 hypothetical protein BMJ31_32810 [Sinorhizobium medicae]PLU35372.1 hypothetical protein BMJ28_17375 [Sinorhizobium medicae]PLU48902.1 hypothetical protein BMJ24_31390 [Sinorhizobium medicae]
MTLQNACPALWFLKARGYFLPASFGHPPAGLCQRADAASSARAATGTKKDITSLSGLGTSSCLSGRRTP